MTDYSIWVCEFARAPESPACFLIHGQPGTRELPFSFSVLQSDEHTVLVDSGFRDQGFSGELGRADGITMWTDPREVLGRIGIEPERVDTILVTHAHYDHLGDVGGYPNATAHIQRREVERWTWALALPDRLQWLKDGVNGEDLEATLELARRGRLRLVDGALEGLLPGLTLEADFDTHTYGHQHVVVNNDRDGRWILPGDDVYTFANVEGIDGSGRFVPIGYATGSQENCLLAMDRMMGAVGYESGRILPGHECLLWDRHPSRTYDDGLRIAEITLRPGDRSRI